MANLLDTLPAKCCTLRLAMQLQWHLLMTGRFRHPICLTRSRLLEVYAYFLHDLPAAIHIFHQIPSPSTNDWNSILRGLIASPSPKDSFRWYQSMMRRSIRPDALSCSFVLKALARIMAMLESWQLHCQVFRRGFIADALLATTLLDVYCKAGQLDYAKKVFDQMTFHDITSWNSLILGMALGSKPSDAIDMFNKLEVWGLKPNAVSVLGALSACSRLGAIKQGEKIHLFIRKEGLDMNVQVCNALIDMHAKCGFIDKAYAVFEEMPCRKCIVSWSTMIMAFAMDGDGVRALDVFDRMMAKGVQPDAVTFLGLLCACNHGGLVEEGTLVFYSMEHFGVKPGIKHYGILVDLLGRSGKLQEAYDAVVSLPMTQDLVIWQTLLGACKTHGNVQLAEFVSRKLAAMGSKNCGDYVLLSHIYATHERWTDVGKVRETMKRKDVRKVPGVSYIEVDNLIHMFYNADINHERWKEIYSKLDEMRWRIREHGHVAETEFVLHDISEEEKENALQIHSEKLALAFGLISISEELPIQIIKNLRICGDCHAVFKLVSKVYRREIIVRDGARFHRFKDGACSCKEYW